jgi:hypothetical protein
MKSEWCVNRVLIVCRFILPLSQVESNLIAILEELQRDPRPVKSDHRPLRATGVALSVAIALLEVKEKIIKTQNHTSKTNCCDRVTQYTSLFLSH